MGYEIFARKIRRVGTPIVSFMRTGRIALNKAASEILVKEAVEYVLLMWDASSRKVALKGITKKDPRAYKIHFGGKGNSGGFSAVTFIEHIGLSMDETRAYPAVWNDEQNMFEVNIQEAAEVKPLLAAIGGAKTAKRR
jgi:hypothetical protein